jgi:hypothetical protein
MTRLESLILLGLIASFSGTLVFVVCTTRMRDGSAQDRGHLLPPQLTSAAKRALSTARRKATTDSLLLTSGQQPMGQDAAGHESFSPGSARAFQGRREAFPEECGAPDTGGAECASWAATNECEVNPDFMRTACVHACGLCGGEPASQESGVAARHDAAVPAQVEADCVDKSSYCGQWAAVGECDSNPNYMRANCKVRVCVWSFAAVASCIMRPSYCLHLPSPSRPPVESFPCPPLHRR